MAHPTHPQLKQVVEKHKRRKKGGCTVYRHPNGTEAVVTGDTVHAARPGQQPRKAHRASLAHQSIGDLAHKLTSHAAGDSPTYTVQRGEHVFARSVPAKQVTAALRRAKGHAQVLDDQTGQIVVVDTDGTRETLAQLAGLLDEYETRKAHAPPGEFVERLGTLRSAGPTRAASLRWRANPERVQVARALREALKRELWSAKHARTVVEAVVATAPDDAWIRGKRSVKRMADAIRAALGWDDEQAVRALHIAMRVAAGPGPESEGSIVLKRPGQKPISLWRSAPYFPPEVPGQPIVRYVGTRYPQLAGLEGRIYADKSGWRSVQWRYPGGTERPWDSRDPTRFPPDVTELIPLQGWSRAFRRPGEEGI